MNAAITKHLPADLEGETHRGLEEGTETRGPTEHFGRFGADILRAASIDNRSGGTVASVPPTETAKGRLPHCQGDWLANTACKKCDKCKDEAALMVARLLDRARELDNKFSALTLTLPKGLPTGFDVSTEFKLSCFEEARRILHERT